MILFLKNLTRQTLRVLAFEPYTVSAGANITQGADGDYCYVVDSGSAHVIVDGKDVKFSYPDNDTNGSVWGRSTNV